MYTSIAANAIASCDKTEITKPIDHQHRRHRRDEHAGLAQAECRNHCPNRASIPLTAHRPPARIPLSIDIDCAATPQ